MQTKTKKQQARLSANVRQAKQNRADVKKSKPRNAPSKPPVKQTGGFLERMFGGKPPKTAQESIPFREMYKDGICQINDRLYTKSVEFGDLNYHLGATRSHTNAIPQGINPCGRLDHIALKMGGFRHFAEATTYALMSGMMG